MIGELQRDIMHFNILGFLIVFTVLKFKHAEVPAPSEVTVKCDSYGVVVNWTAAVLSSEAEFQLEIKPNFGEIIYVRTNEPFYNISSLLNDPAYNKYVVQVKVRDGEQESKVVNSEAFSFNSLVTVNITCSLKFPPVTLFPRDGKFFVHFVNPLHLYRNTPALRNLTRSDTLQYGFTSDKLSQEFSCNVESKTCESNILFPEEQMEYCITLMGHVRQTLIRQTGPSCYSGPLYPVLPVTTFLFPLLLTFAVFVTLALASVFLVRKVKKIIKKKNLSKLPRCLNNFPFTPLITPLKPEQDLVGVNPRVEPDVTLTLDTMCDLQVSTVQMKRTHDSSNIAACVEDVCERSENGDSRGSWNTYGNAADLSSSNFSESYECSHWSH